MSLNPEIPYFYIGKIPPVKGKCVIFAISILNHGP